MPDGLPAACRVARGGAGMKLAIMQPYFLPYVGYFQLIAAADAFVIYDNIKYTKKGWINRNRMLLNGADAVFSLPLAKGSDELCVDQRVLSDAFDREKMLARFRGAYARAPQFQQVFPLLEDMVRHPENNLFRYIHHSVVRLCRHLGIGTEIIVSSQVAIDHGLKAQDKVLALCQALGASTYINAIGGLELYDRTVFAQHGIDLKFIQPRPFEYTQFGSAFVPWLSLVDVLMFNPLDAVRACVDSNYGFV